jgi:hypothetical protein
MNSAPFTFLGLPWLNNLSGFFNNNYSLGRYYLEKTAGGTWEITRAFNLTRALSFTPRANYSNTYTYFSRDSTNVDQLNETVGRYLAAGTLRIKTRAGNSDITQTYSRRLVRDSFNVDVGANDYGIETNQLSLVQTYRPGRTVLVRVGSGYDFREFKDHAVGFHDSLQPIQSDVILTPGAAFNLALRDDYLLGTGNRNTIINSTWGDEMNTFITAGVGYNLSQADHYYVNTEAGWSNSTGTLHVGVAVRSTVISPGGFGGLHSFYVFDREAQIIKRWHDFYTKLTCRFRPGNVKEYTIRIEMKFGGFDAERKKVHNWESEWFPERVYGKEDRP